MTVDVSSRPLSKARVHGFFQALQGERPDPKGELDYVNPYTLLVAVILSAQATDVGVNKATAPLFKVADTPQKMLDLGEEKLRHFIRTIGLFNTKAKNVLAMSGILIDRYDGHVPQVREDLQTLPGVGRKTANVVLNIAFGIPTIAVDTHVFRVANRTGLALGKTPLDVEKKLEGVVPEEFFQHAHHWLILHGRYTCKARKPLCHACSAHQFCNWPDRRSHVSSE